MPIKKYDRYFNGSAEKTLAAMVKQYGPKKGRQVFYASVNKKKRRESR